MNSSTGPKWQAAFGRFAFKLIVSVVGASFGVRPFLLALSSWLALFGLLTAIFALLRREPFRNGASAYWHEVLWLVGTSTVLVIVHLSMNSALQG